MLGSNNSTQRSKKLKKNKKFGPFRNKSKTNL